MSDIGYNTNLAAEYHVLSMLYRMGYNAYLTLGNKKSIDIVIDHRQRTTTIDVKGMVSKTLWPMDNFSGGRKNHWIALVTFQNKIDDYSVMPQTFILPSSKVRSFLYENPKRTRKGIRYAAMRTRGKKYLEAWHLLQ